MVRPREKRTGLPECVYKKHNAYYYVKGGKWTRLGKTEAEMYKALAKLKGQARGEPGMKLLFDRYAKDVLTKKHQKTREEQEKQLVLLRAVYDKMEPGAVQPKHVAQYLDKRGQTAPVAANREIALLSHVFKKAIRWGIVSLNPCTGVERNEEKPRDRYVEDWEFAAVYQRAPEHLQIIMDLAYITGQRQADLLNIRLQDLTDEGILFKQAKTGAKLCVEWSDSLRSVIDRAKAIEKDVASMWLISNKKGQRYTSSGIQTAWQRLMVDCLATQDKDGNKIEPVIRERFTFHDIRAKARSDGEDKALLGHADPAKMARTYQRKAVKVKPVK